MKYLISIVARTEAPVPIAHKIVEREDLLVVFAEAMMALEEITWANTPPLLSAQIFVLSPRQYVGEVLSPM